MHFTDILNLAAAAWHEIKDANDPEFNECQVTHREKLGAAAKAVVDSGQAFDRFDRVVLRLHKERLEAMAKVEQLAEAHPLAHADEIMHMAAGVPHPLGNSGLTDAIDVQRQANALVGHAEDAVRESTREEFNAFHDKDSKFIPSPSSFTVALNEAANIDTNPESLVVPESLKETQEVKS